ncbi:MAG: hypothetical protein CL675_01100 [Bdellovibrionaceae bacterium]|nr:hypothetical protein [Pseudobdellovibrionaceae bacterium]
MSRTKVYVVTDDYSVFERTRSFYQGQDVQVEYFTPGQWEQRQGGGSNLTMGAQPVEQGAKILPFPGQAPSATHVAGVRTINELESDAIEKAIFEFNGNLTEAAKALGIGRATLYRKVKQYNIDPSLARKKRAA